MTTLTKSFKAYKFRQSSTLLVALSLLVSPTLGTHANASVTDCFEQQVITRVDDISDTGYVHSHWEDSQGNIYRDSSKTEDVFPSFHWEEGLYKDASIPSQYDLRNEGLVTPIKDQGKSGCCWAFSAIKALESNGIRCGLFPLESADLSENHLAWFSYNVSSDFNDPLYGDGMSAPNQLTTLIAPSYTYPYDHGGSAILATFTLARGSGPVSEAIAPFHAASASAIQKMADAMKTKSDLRYNAAYRLKNSVSFDEYTVSDNYYYKNSAMISQMKQAIMEHGAMSIGLYFDKTQIKTTSAGSAYYQTDYTQSLAVDAANHCVTVVGWDDDFSRSNFQSRPAGNGAWLVANSYGTEFGDNGYFWVSYYESSICDCFTFELDSSSTYQNVYQYDGFGWSSANYSNSKDIKAANIFTVKQNSPQALSAVSFYTLSDNQEYKIEIYRGVSSKPTDGILIDSATTTGTIEHNGYYTIPLANPVNVSSGETFSVVVTYLQNGSRTIYVPIEGKTKSTSDYSLQYFSKPGQSFLYTRKTTSSKLNWYDTNSLGYNNVCIKVHSNDTAAADSLAINAGKIVLGKGESYRLANDGNRTFSSSDPSIATVSSAGKITALATGTTTINISSGVTTKIMTVTVKKAPSRIRIKPSGKKKIRKGKSFKIRVKLPSGSACNKITYRSSRKKVVSVSSKGIVTAKRKGKAVITVKTYNKKKAKLRVIVKKK